MKTKSGLLLAVLLVSCSNHSPAKSDGQAELLHLGAGRAEIFIANPGALPVDIRNQDEWIKSNFETHVVVRGGNYKRISDLVLEQDPVEFSESLESIYAYSPFALVEISLPAGGRTSVSIDGCFVYVRDRKSVQLADPALIELLASVSGRPASEFRYEGVDCDELLRSR